MKKFLKGLLILVAVVAAFAVVCALLPKPQNFSLQNPMLKDSPDSLPILIAHGGGNREFPDNTLEAFYNAYSVDPRVMMETDVSITKDGVVILSHDVRLDRKTNVTGEIADWNYADLIAQKVDFGYTNDTKSQKLVEGSALKKFTTEDGRNVTPLDVPYPDGVTPRDTEVFLATTLEELITCFPNNRINVEIKQEGEKGMECMREILRLLEKHNAWDRVVLASFHNDIYAEYQRLQKAGEVPETFMCSPGLGNAALFYVLQLLNLDVFYTEETCVFQLPTEYEIAAGPIELTIDLATEHLIDTAHKHNLAVHYWTINDKDEMRMLIELGADGIMSDYPHRLAEVYAEYSK
ncbi:MAG: hypothetical protein E7318_10870 [Clostridiales bacterium]|nr:hypothetical protein [Clostridiales bacterium]